MIVIICGRHRVEGADDGLLRLRRIDMRMILFMSDLHCEALARRRGVEVAI